MCGFNPSERKQLKSVLLTEFDSIREQTKSVQNVMFSDTAPEHYPRVLKQQWNKESRTVLAAQKRNCLIAIYESGLLNAKASAFNKKFESQNYITTITNAQLSAMRTMAHVKGVLRLPSIKQKNNKLISIDDTLQEIKNKNKNNNNQTRGRNQLCDAVMAMKQLLNICIKELKQSETEIVVLLINLRIIKYENEQRIHIYDRKINGHILRAPELLSVFDKVLEDINEVKKEIQNKLDSVKTIFTNKKLTNIESKANKMKKAKAVDAKRQSQNNRKKTEANVTDTAGLNIVESD